MQAIMDGTSGDALDKAKEVRVAEVASGAIIGVFESTYLGSVIVEQLKGIEVVETAAKRVIKLKAVPQGVFVNVGTEGIKIFEALTHEVGVLVGKVDRLYSALVLVSH